MKGRSGSPKPPTYKFQLWYIPGDPISTNIHVEMGTINDMKAVLVHKEFTNARIALGYAFCLFDFPDTWINRMDKKFNLKKGGYFVIVDKRKQQILHNVVDTTVTKLEEPNERNDPGKSNDPVDPTT